MLPVAVIGMSCRFPQCSSATEYWRLIKSGADAITPAPEDRLALWGQSADGNPYWGGYVEDIAGCDTTFFELSPREAIQTDPQLRLFLMVAYEALEDAGLLPAELGGSDTGVFVGQATSNYWELMRSFQEPDIYSVVGAEVRASVPGRVSYAFDFRGPSASLDTACSSSLAAVHAALMSLTCGESSIAIVGGVNLLLSTAETDAYASAGMLARDGRCKFGDASADGFVRSDGIGAIVLKPLDAALRDHDRIYCVAAGSAMGNDGRSGGFFMTPGIDGQRRVLAAAYRTAGVSPADVAYIEAHGTGTAAGDPIELQAIADVLLDGRPVDQACVVGSVKGNVGHTEATAGVAGLMKAALCLYHGEMVPSLHHANPTPHFSWETVNVRLAEGGESLASDGDAPTYVGVNSFGISGTNVHVVLRNLAADDAV